MTEETSGPDLLTQSSLDHIRKGVEQEMARLENRTREFSKKHEDEQKKRMAEYQEKLLEMELAERKDKAQSRQTVRRVLVGMLSTAGVVVTATGGFVMWKLSTWQGPAEETKEAVQELKQTEKKVTKPVEEVDKKLENFKLKTDEKFDVVVEILQDQQVQGIDGHDQVVDMIEKAHPGTRKIAENEPDSIEQGRIKAKAIKASRKKSINPADPLGGI